MAVTVAVTGEGEEVDVRGREQALSRLRQRLRMPALRVVEMKRFTSLANPLQRRPSARLR